jgi:hypothetical protein
MRNVISGIKRSIQPIFCTNKFDGAIIEENPRFHEDKLAPAQAGAAAVRGVVVRNNMYQ